MSMSTYVDCGYGIDADKLEKDFMEYNPDFENAYDKLMMILDDAPMFKEDYMSWLDDNMMDLNEEGIEFCFQWEGFGHGLGEILRCIITEKFGLEFVVSTDENSGVQYLMYTPCFPWQMSPSERGLTESDINAIFDRYTNILCNVKAETGTVRAEYCC